MIYELAFYQLVNICQTVLVVNLLLMEYQLLLKRALVAQLGEHRAVTREVVSSTPAGPTLRVFK